MRICLTFKTLFFMSTIALCAACASNNGSGTGGAGSASSTSNLVADGITACKSYCPLEIDYAQKNPYDVGRQRTYCDMIDMDTCISNCDLQFNRALAQSQACAEAIAERYICNLGTPSTIGCFYGNISNSGCPNQDSAANAACP
jgi:hypothetical protein